MVLELSSLIQLRQLLSDESKITIIDFYADWCGPCKMVAPHYVALANDFEKNNGGPSKNNGASVQFLKCNVDRCREIAQHYNVKSMPTFIVFQGPKEVERFAGADIGRVERVAKSNLAYLSQQRAQAGLGGTSGGAGRALGTAAAAEDRPDPHATGLLNAPARYFVNIAAAAKKAAESNDNDNTSAAAEEVEKLVKDLHSYLTSQVGGQGAMPLGAQLIPFLVTSETDYGRVPNEPVNVFFETLMKLGQKAKAEAEAEAETAAHGGNGVVCKDGVCSIVPPTTTAATITPISFGADGSVGVKKDDGSSASASPFVASQWAYTKSFSYAEDAVAIITNLVRIATNALTFETWHVSGAGNVTAHTLPNPNEAQMQRLLNQNGAPAAKPPPPPPYAGRWHLLLQRLLRCETVLRVIFAPGAVFVENNKSTKSLAELVYAVANPGPLVYSKWMKTGKQLELNTFLGALLSVGFYPARASLQQQQIQVMAMLHPSALMGQGMDTQAIKAEVDGHAHSIANQIHSEMDAHVNRCYPIFRELLGKKGAVRTGVLRWIHSFFAANAGFTRQNREKSELCSDTAMLTLANVLVELALPITGAMGFEKTIPTDYYSDLNAFAVGLPEEVAALVEEGKKGAERSEGGRYTYADGTLGGPNDTNKAICQQLLTTLNTRALVSFGLHRTDVERVCHFKAPKEEVLDDCDEVELLMAMAQSSSGGGGAAATSAANKAAEESDNAAAAPASSTTSPAEAGDESVFPLPPVDPRGGTLPLTNGATGTTKLLTPPCSPNSGTGTIPTTLADAIACQGVNHYAPRVHIFYMAMRAVSLTTTVTLSTIQSLEQQLHHPRTNARDAGFLRALIATHKAMITNGTWARKTVQFLNGVARWLLSILGADRETGTFPQHQGGPSKAWQLMPQQVIDEVLTAMTLVTKHNVHSLHPTDVDDIISLLLVLMGNLAYFPKAHTHALFPTIIIELLNSQMFAPALTRHRWFQSNIVLGCIRTYIAMEKCYYEKTNCRYYLSVCLKRFLNEDVLCYPARQTLQDTTARTLEKFTHMVTTEANQAIDEVLTALAQMRKLEAEGKDAVDDGNQHNATAFNANANAGNRNRRQQGGGNNRRRNNNNNNAGSIYTDSDSEGSAADEDNANDGTIASETYPQLGEKLKNGLLIFSETIVVFRLLSRQFQAGVLQHMVSQQISNMLVQNISKLAGKNSAELKVKNPETWGFNPRNILDSLVECFVHFRREKVFISCVLESIHAVSTPSDFEYAIANITNPNRTLVVPSLASELREMHATLKKANVGRDMEELIWDDDAPEWAFCALMSTPLRDPVALPMPHAGGGGAGGNADAAEQQYGDPADFIFVERDVIRHRLLELEENPFSREKLTEAQLNAHNNVPVVKKAVEELKARIAEYAAKRRAELVASKAAETA